MVAVSHGKEELVGHILHQSIQRSADLFNLLFVQEIPLNVSALLHQFGVVGGGQLLFL